MRTLAATTHCLLLVSLLWLAATLPAHAKGLPSSNRPSPLTKATKERCKKWAERAVQAERQALRKLCRGVSSGWEARVQINQQRCLLKALDAKNANATPLLATYTVQARMRDLCRRKRRVCSIFASKSLRQAKRNKERECEQPWPLDRRVYRKTCLRSRLDVVLKNLKRRDDLLSKCETLQRAPNLLGCYHDKKRNDLKYLLGKGYLPTRCVLACRNKGYRYAGVQYGGFCFCDNRFGRYGKRPRLECDSPCSANKKKYCGGPWRNHIYKTGIRPFLRHETYLGCFLDKKKRDLPHILSNKHTPKSCTLACRRLQYSYAGLQNGGWCLCGNRFGKYGKRPPVECEARCRMNRRYACGGAWRNRIYATGVPAPANGRGYLGCYLDRATRDLNVLVGSGYRPSSCVFSCYNKGFPYAGLQYGSWCFCGIQFGRYGKRPEHECRSRCKRNGKTLCGGPWRNSVYKTTGFAPVGNPVKKKKADEKGGKKKQKKTPAE